MATAKKTGSKSAGKPASKKTATKVAARSTSRKTSVKVAAKPASKKKLSRSPIKSASRAPAGKSKRRDALDLLQADHDAVKKLFNRFERNKDAMSAGEKSEMVRKICGELTVHAQIEEEIFYRALRQVADDDLNEMLDEAEVEHTGAKDLIAQLQAATPDDRLYDAKVTVLGEGIKHHAGEEEDSMFRKVRRLRKDVNLVVLGEQLAGRSAELKAELGLL